MILIYTVGLWVNLYLMMRLKYGMVIQIFMWKNLEEILNTSDDSDIG